MPRNRFNVIRDTREQKDFWTFANYDIVDTVIDKKLDTGDYTIEGMEENLCIERKRNVSELAKNLFEDRFERELERMKEFYYSFLILSFGLDDVYNYPFVDCIPYKVRKRIKVRGPLLFKRLGEISVKYQIPIIPCGHNKYAEELVISIMKRVYESENK
jgi:ERCC4-type nuclease